MGTVTIFFCLKKVVEPAFERRSDYEDNRCSRKMGVKEAFTEGRSEKEDSSSC